MTPYKYIKTDLQDTSSFVPPTKHLKMLKKRYSLIFFSSICFIIGWNMRNFKNILRTFALIVSAHPYCARKFACHVIHERAR